MGVNTKLVKWLQDEIVDLEEAVLELEKVIETHEYFKKVYFWGSPGGASGRRRYEEEHSNDMRIDFKNGGYLKVEQDVTCSCNHIYYNMYIDIEGYDGKYGKHSIRLIKDIYNELEQDYYECAKLLKGLMISFKKRKQVFQIYPRLKQVKAIKVYDIPEYFALKYILSRKSIDRYLKDLRIPKKEIAEALMSKEFGHERLINKINNSKS